MNARIQAQIAELTRIEPGTAMEGGFFTGYILVPEGAFGIITAPKAIAQFRGPWADDPKLLPTTESYYSCRANTEAMAKSGCELAEKMLALNIGGFTDWALPSRDVLELQYRNLKPTARKNYTSFRDGDNASSLPVGYPYTEDFPAQTACPLFQAGGAEAFEPEIYF